jgi:hypothetical protein
MDWDSVNNSFSYTDGMTIWFASDGTFTHDGVAKTSVFNPTMDLDYGTTYTVTFDTTATNQSGLPLDQDQDGTGGEVGQDELIWQFTTDIDHLPTIDVWEPGGTAGQIHIQGDMVDITWVAGDNNPLPQNPINITYGSGVSWTPIANDEANDGLYAWDTSAVPCPATYWINASVYDSGGQTVFGESNFSFTLDCAPDFPPTVEAWEPGGTSGQTHIQGDLIDVTWTASDDNPLPANPINITYGAGALWNPISNDEANDGLYAWDTSSVPCPGTYWMNISAYDSAGQTTFAESNFSFTLDCPPDNPPNIEAWEPGGFAGQIFTQGDLVDVTWSASDDNPLPVNPINITYGAGAVWNPIANDEANDGLYQWDTSSVPCPETYWMNVSAYDSSGQTTFDEGNSSFTIFCPGDSPPVIAVYEPGSTTGQVFTQGDLVDIVWSASDNNPLPLNPVNLTYRVGAVWTPIANDEGNDGIYSWDTSSVPCPATYWINASVYDSAGQTTFNEGNFSFILNCVPGIPPALSATTPAHTDAGVALDQDVVITFSEAIETNTFDFTISPDPGGWSWNWNPTNTTVTGTHNDFISLTTYTFTVTQANDASGDQLVAGAAPNPWFWTTADAVAPSITGVVVTPSTPEIGDDVTISATITDASGVVTVTIIITDPDGIIIADNVTMPAGSGTNEYSFDVPGTNTGVEGTYTFTIWTNDSSGNFNSHTSTFDVTDSSIPPVAVTVTVKDKYHGLVSNADVVIKDSVGAIVASGLTTNGVFETFGWLWTFLIIMIIVIVVLVLLVLLLMRRKKNREQMNGDI